MGRVEDHAGGPGEGVTEGPETVVRQVAWGWSKQETPILPLPNPTWSGKGRGRGV